MRYLVFLLCLLLQVSAMAQSSGNPIADSLIGTIPATRDDTARARLYKKIVDELTGNNPPEAMRYAEIGMKHVQLMKWKKGIGVFYNLIGSLHNVNGQYAAAVSQFEQALAIHRTNKDIFNAASVLNNIGTAYFRQSVFDKASEYYIESLKLAEQIEDKYLTAICLGNLATVSFQQGDYDKALESQFKALRIRKTIEGKDESGILLFEIGNSYFNKKDTGNARKFYNEALQVLSASDDRQGIASVYSSLALMTPDYTGKLDFQLKAQAIWDELNPGYTTSVTNLGNIAYTYLDLARYDSLRPAQPSEQIPAGGAALLQKAEAAMARAFAQTMNSQDLGNYSFLMGLKAEIEFEKGNYRMAYTSLKSYHQLNDSIFSQETKNRIATIEGRREVALRDKEIELNKIALSNQRKLGIALLTGIVLLLVIGGLLFRQGRMRKKSNSVLLQLNQELDEANKVKARFFAILSHDLRGPVASIVNFLHLQKEAPDLMTAEQEETHRQKLTDSAHSLLENMETMLLWSKDQMKRFVPVNQPVTAAALFLRLEKTFANSTRATIRFSDPENLLVITDENYLFTIMQNLTANAIQALKSTEAPVIEWEASAEKGGAAFSIRDNGPGIDPALLLPEETGGLASNTSTGFGLHLVRDLARAIGCSISAEPAPGGGSCIRLQLPAGE